MKQNESTGEIKTLLIITVVIIAVSALLYLVTEKNLKDKGETPEAPISYSEVLIGNMFTRPYEEYFVIAYSSEDKDATKLDDIFSKYEDKEDAKKIYFVDLDDEFNKDAKSDKANKKPTNPDEVKIKEKALILINNGKVTKYYETLEEIEKALS